MPNWCSNEVDLYCDNAEVLSLFRAECCTNDVFDFYKIRPLGLPAEDGTPFWDYNIAVDRWGTKWNLVVENYEDFWWEDTSLSALFDTAWNPPNGIYEAIIQWFEERGADVEITWFYREDGLQLAGWLPD
jgi:hypothetical protein